MLFLLPKKVGKNIPKNSDHDQEYPIITRKEVKTSLHSVGEIIVGYNPEWKQSVNIGKKNNQKFVSIPFDTFIKQLEYKGKIAGITVRRITEEYTSQTCSRCGIVRKSNRKHRGLYVCSECGLKINADVNASKNMLHKGVPNSTREWNIGCLNHPLVLKV